MKRVAECVMPGAQVEPCPARPFEHPARSAEVRWKSRTVGRLFELHPSLVETGRAAILDVDLRAVQSLRTAGAKYTPIRRYPSSAFDLSVIAAVREHAGALDALLRSFAGPLLESVEFVRQYSGPPLEEEESSPSATVGSPERTLSSAVTAIPPKSSTPCRPWATTSASELRPWRTHSCVPRHSCRRSRDVKT
jgi:phenylalanyl-tRNA synthetase beta chain